MKKFFSNLFNDNNSINEKSVIGFAAFVIMVVFAISDIASGFLGKDLIVNEFIFNSFLYLTLGCFGIASIDKYINKSKSSEENQEEQP